MLNFYHISVMQFFKSHWAEVRAGAAMFIGMLLLPAGVLARVQPYLWETAQRPGRKPGAAKGAGAWPCFLFA